MFYLFIKDLGPLDEAFKINYIRTLGRASSYWWFD
jgi:hypothetical protein